MERLLKVYIDKNNTESTVDGLEALHWGHYLFGWGYGICMPALHRVTCVCVCAARGCINLDTGTSACILHGP